MSNQQELLRQLAEESVGVFEQISKKADEKLKAYPGDPTSSFAAGNTFTSSAAGNLLKIQDKNKQDYLGLRLEPAIARIVVENDDGETKTYYISRHGSISLGGSVLLADYNTAIGRLASLPVGEERTLDINGQKITVYKLANTTYKPVRQTDGWDSNPSVITDDELGKFTIESLRKLIGIAEVDESDELEALLSELYDDGVSNGLTHQTRTAMALRDQPILDEFQDEIFRQPINNQLIILGPPGTGKTTTLIKRLGQKINTEYLDDSEKIYAIDTQTSAHSVNWLMFTPSDLLKHYVKEAFNRELVPASDDNIKTWKSFRNDLARNVLNILKTPTGGRFSLSSKNEFLTDDIKQDARSWFDEYSDFHTSRIVKQLNDGVEIIEESCPVGKEELVEKIKKAVGDAKNSKLKDIYSRLNLIEVDIAPALRESKEKSDKLLKKERNLLFNKNKEVFYELADYLTSLADEEEGDDEDGIFDEDVEQTDQDSQKQTDIQKAVNSYLSAIRGMARYKYRKRSVPKRSKAAKIRDWLGDRVPSEEALKTIGQEITFQNGLRRYVNSTRRYLAQTPNSFLAYRKTLLDNDVIYKLKPLNNYQIDSTELDAIILLMLRNTRNLISQSYINRNIEDQRFTFLATIVGKLRTQVLVDEATDFSVLQLACMEALTKIDSNSFFACGDFNQRITGEGIRSEDQLDWINKNIVTKRINTVYRQSRKLNAFAKSMLEALEGDMSSLGVLPDESIHDGVNPVLLESGKSLEEQAAWLADRIAEVETIVQQMPTIAILVKSEDDVKPVAEALNAYLEDYSLQAVACLEGQTIGQDTDVRVFDVQHIKGLEFEAVFFVDVDGLAENLPELFDRYLYVGSTRAATYLGLTCTGILPTLIEGLRSQFTGSWK